MRWDPCGGIPGALGLRGGREGSGINVAFSDPPRRLNPGYFNSSRSRAKKWTFAPTVRPTNGWMTEAFGPALRGT